MPRLVGERRNTVPVSLYVSEALADALRERGHRVGSRARAAREALTDHLQWYGLPSVIVDALVEDAGPRRGQREYVIEVLVRRYDELVRARAGRQSEPLSEPPLRAANE